MRAGVKKYQQASQAEQEKKDEKLKEELVLKYAPLVKNIAERMAVRLPPHICKEELIGPGVLGLFDAIEKFDSRREIKFRTYANLRIKGAMLDELRKMDWISRSIRRYIHRIEDAMRSLHRQVSDTPSPFDELKIKESKKIISEALSKLSKKEQLVMSLYYYDELTLKEIAKVLNLTESRISQIHSKVIIKLRVKLKSYYKE
ncbi:MAG: sigma-70 family RNA polymerase sigma factor [Deltaproteobacteria bacterium]|nr:sigma-70 family RNA polymerase sigma factor [Deltaproteobacteria bacterium]